MSDVETYPQITSVSWPIASERVDDRSEKNQAERELPNHGYRMRLALDKMSQRCTALFPNADIYIIDGGVENQYASFGPNWEGPDDFSFDEFFDIMIHAEDMSTAEAIEAFPYLELDYPELNDTSAVVVKKDALEVVFMAGVRRAEYIAEDIECDGMNWEPEDLEVSKTELASLRAALTRISKDATGTFEDFRI